MSRERLKQRLQELQAQTGDTIDNLNKTLNASTTNPASSSLIAGPLSLVKELQKKVMDMQVSVGSCFDTVVRLVIFAKEDVESARSLKYSSRLGKNSIRLGGF